MNRSMRCMITMSVCVTVLGLSAVASDLIISEIAWAGTAAASTDEWIELQNAGDVAVDLTGWQLAYGDTLIFLGEVEENTIEVRTTTLAPGQFLLLERTDDSTISDITADVLYSGALSNAGILVELRDPEGVVIDSVVLGEEGGWPAGCGSDGEPPYCTMERTHLGEWTTNNAIVINGLDVAGNPLNGTPGQPNSVDVLAQWAPSVQLTYPAEAGVILSGMTYITWIAVDPDGESSGLAIAIDITTNAGEDWNRIIDNLANTGTFPWDTTALTPGTTYQLRIHATDFEGYFGEATSPLFEIAHSED